MKFLVVLVCALAAASASHVASPIVYAAHHSYHGPQHLPIIDHEGVPVDTADVQIAKAAHLSQKVHVAARNGDLAVHAPVVAHSAVVAAHAAPVVAAYAAPAVAHSAVVSAHAAPVVAAHTAYTAGLVSPHGFVDAYHGGLAHSAYAHHGHGLVDAHHGVVAHSAYSHHGLVYRKRRGVFAGPVAYHAYHGYHGAQHLPLINHEGVPVDTADVQHARAAHLSQKVHVAARNGDLAIHAPVIAHSAYAHHDGVYGHHHAYSAPLAHYY